MIQTSIWQVFARIPSLTQVTAAQVAAGQVTAGLGGFNLLYAALAVPLAYVGYQEWQKSKKKKTRKKKAA